MGQGNRSKVKVSMSKNVHWDVRLTSESLGLQQKKLSDITGMNTTWGVFKVYAVSFL